MKLPEQNTNDEFFGDFYDSYGEWCFWQGCLVPVQQQEMTYEELLQMELNDAKGG